MIVLSSPSPSVKRCSCKSLLRHTVRSHKDVIDSVPVSGGDIGPIYGMSTQLKARLLSSLFGSLFLSKCADHFV